MTFLAGLAGCGAAKPRPGAPAAEPVKAATTQAAPPAEIAATEMPPDSLLILVTARNAYTVQDSTASCEGLPALLKPYRESNLVLAGSGGFALSIADAICVGKVAKERGGKAYLTHPEGLRTIDVQD